MPVYLHGCLHVLIIISIIMILCILRACFFAALAYNKTKNVFVSAYTFFKIA